MDQRSVVTRRLSEVECRPLWRLRHDSREFVSRSLVFIPALYLAAAVALAIALPAIQRANGSSDLLGIDASASQAILGDVASGMIAFSGLVVSVAVLVVQFSAGQYSPRLVPIFRRDPVIKNALGLFVAPGVFALVTLADIGGHGHDDSGTLVVIGALVLMIAALIALFRFIGRLMDLMRPRRIYAQLLHEAGIAMEMTYPFPYGEELQRLPVPTGPLRATVRNEHRDSVLVAVDRARLVQIANERDLVVEIVAQIGFSSPYHAPILLVSGDGEIDAREVRSLRRALMFSIGRRAEEDPAFAIRCIVDVAIRALSPAINDPTSAVEGLDALDAVLRRLGSRRLDAAGVIDDDGVVRLILPTADWDELLDLALTEIRRYGANSPQLSRRLSALLGDLDATIPAHRRAAVDRHRRLLTADLERLYPDPDERAFAATPDRLGLGGWTDTAPLAAMDGAHQARVL